jgi:tRNA (uracil-5-)-methyltransferase
VIKTLRLARNITRLVYVSCSIATFTEDAVKLALPSKNKHAYARGVPFRPVQAVPFDLFPHTPHTELAVLFVRDTEGDEGDTSDDEV